MGEVGEPPDYYFIHRAAEILGCSFLEIEGHPQRSRLMSIAFTLDNGRADGHAMLKKNPKFKEMLNSDG